MKIIISCEHGGNQIPQEYQAYFTHEDAVLNTHLGFDIGALSVAKFLAEKADYFIYSETSRLLVDLNRSLKHSSLYSKYSRLCDQTVKDQILQNYYTSYRNQIITQIENFNSAGFHVIHISVHSFTPVLNNVTRNTDIGLLYDPRRENEKKFCQTWQNNLRAISKYKVRLNYPYLGIADGLTTFLRKKFNATYMGIELEMNQKLFENFDNTILQKSILNSFLKTLSQPKNDG